ncbi:zeta toxin family protein [Priestia flexa]|uniref:zeta toxin family protein n=1 Tax=Priestia flexa TaxID=86664 RepID=UPI001EF619EE|nr:zeta toxin family protein [Priestia flexa]MCG7314934.1 zeta toxin family protein [Priestia flexa]
METTQGIYSVNGVYKPTRQDLHGSIIQDILVDAPIQNNPPDSILLGGGVAAGKSSTSGMYLKVYHDEGMPLTYINSDDIKKYLPEYVYALDEGNPDAAKIVHDESSDIAYRIIEQCIREKRQFMYDGTMKNTEKYKELIHRLKSEGYKVSLVVVDISVELAKSRAKLREEIEGRVVPEKIIEESHAKVSKTFSEIKGDVDSYIVYDNTGKEPIPFLIKNAYDEPEEIQDESRLELFYAKSQIVTK